MIKMLIIMCSLIAILLTLVVILVFVFLVSNKKK